MGRVERERLWRDVGAVQLTGTGERERVTVVAQRAGRSWRIQCSRGGDGGGRGAQPRGGRLTARSLFQLAARLFCFQTGGIERRRRRRLVA